MTIAPTDRRRHRRHGAAGPYLQFARIRGGHDVLVVDVSAAGMLVESAHRLLPGTAVDVRLEGERHAVEIVRGRVVRCAVARLEANAIFYRGAIAFDRELGGFADSVRNEYRLPVPDPRQIALCGH